MARQEPDTPFRIGAAVVVRGRGIGPGAVKEGKGRTGDEYLDDLVCVPVGMNGSKAPGIELGVPRLYDHRHELVLDKVGHRIRRQPVIEVLFSPGERKERRIGDAYDVVCHTGLPHIQDLKVGPVRIRALPQQVASIVTEDQPVQVAEHCSCIQGPLHDTRIGPGTGAIGQHEPPGLLMVLPRRTVLVPRDDLEIDLRPARDPRDTHGQRAVRLGGRLPAEVQVEDRQVERRGLGEAAVPGNAGVRRSKGYVHGMGYGSRQERHRWLVAHNAELGLLQRGRWSQRRSVRLNSHAQDPDGASCESVPQPELDSSDPRVSVISALSVHCTLLPGGLWHSELFWGIM